jgi:hypothetical protein
MSSFQEFVGPCALERSFSDKGRVVFIGLSADMATGLVPLLVRLPNAEGRCAAG